MCQQTCCNTMDIIQSAPTDGRSPPMPLPNTGTFSIYKHLFHFILLSLFWKYSVLIIQFFRSSLIHLIECNACRMELYHVQINCQEVELHQKAYTVSLLQKCTLIKGYLVNLRAYINKSYMNIHIPKWLLHNWD